MNDLGEVRAGVRRIAELSRKAGAKLADMETYAHDRPLVNQYIEEVAAIGVEAVAIEPAYKLVMQFNQVGVFKRLCIDRAIDLDTTLTDLERQRRRIARDRLIDRKSVV